MFYMEFLALMWNLARFQSDTKSGRFILPTGRSGDLSKFRESPGESGRLNMYVQVLGDLLVAVSRKHFRDTGHLQEPAVASFVIL